MARISTICIALALALWCTAGAAAQGAPAAAAPSQSLDGKNFKRVQVKSSLGTCLAIGKAASKPYTWACTKGDARQVWFWYPNKSRLQSSFNACLAIDARNNSSPYTKPCSFKDATQIFRMTYPSNSKYYNIRSDYKLCVTLDKAGNNRTVYGTRCDRGDPRQWFQLVRL